MPEASSRKKLVRNTVFSAISSFSDVFLLLLLIFSGRYLGAEYFGIFSLALAISSVLTFLTNLGLDSLAIRQIAMNKSHAQIIISSILIWKTLISFFILIVYVIIIRLYISDELTLYTAYILGPASILRSYNMTFRSFIQAFENFKLESLIVLSERILLFVAGFVSLVIITSPIWLACVFLVARLIASIIYLISIHRSVCPLRLKFDYQFIKSFQAEALPIGISTIIYGVYSQVDTIILGMFRSYDVVGIFSSALKIFEGTMVLSLIINSVVYPRLSILFNQNKSRFLDLYNRSLKYLLMVSVMIIAVGLFFSEDVILLLFGESYISASTSLAILFIASACFFIVAISHTIFRAIGDLKVIVYTMLLALIAKVVLGFILIPSYGAEGASYSVLFSILIMLIISMFNLDKHNIPFKNIYKPLIKILVSIFVASVPLIVLPELPFLIKVAILVGSYILALFMTKSFDIFELEMIKGILPSFKSKK